MRGSSPCGGRIVRDHLQTPHSSVHKLVRDLGEQCRAGATRRGGGTWSPCFSCPSWRQSSASGSSARVSFPAVNSGIFPHGMAEVVITASSLHHVPTSSATMFSHALEQPRSCCWGSGFPDKSCLKQEPEPFSSYNILEIPA